MHQDNDDDMDTKTEVAFGREKQLTFSKQDSKKLVKQISR